jgi:hypothetical protein
MLVKIRRREPNQSYHSEVHLQSKLDRTWATYLVERIQSSETATQHGYGFSKQRPIAKIAFRVSEIRMIENIEKFGPELQW